MANIYNNQLAPGEHDKFSVELGNGMRIRGFQCSPGVELSINDDRDERPMSRALCGVDRVQGSPNRRMFYSSIKPRNGLLTGVVRNISGQSKNVQITLFYDE